MMKGSTNTQQAPQKMDPMQAMLGYFIPGYGKNTASTMGTKGSSQRQPEMRLPAAPEYVNYQQMPVYSSQPAAPSDAITRFMSSGYASGGSVEPDTSASLEEDIKAALRLARMIGELTKKS